MPPAHPTRDGACYPGMCPDRNGTTISWIPGPCSTAEPRPARLEQWFSKFPQPAASLSSGNWLEMKISGPTTDLLHQNLYRKKFQNPIIHLQHSTVILPSLNSTASQRAPNTLPAPMKSLTEESTDHTDWSTWTPLRAKLSSCGEDTGHTIYYLSAPAPSIRGPVKVLFGGKPVCCLPWKPLPRPDMRCMWQIFVLWVFWVLILCLMVPCLDRKPEPAPQEKLTYLVPWRGNCLWFKFRKCGCPSGSLNYSLCHHTVREQNWFDACYEKTMGYLMRTTESMTPDAVLWWLGMNSASELGKVWEKLFKVIARPSVSHNDLYCGTCVLVGNSKVLRASGLSNNVTQHTTVFRTSQAPVQGFKMVGNQTTGRFTCRRNVGVQGSWRQLLLLLLKLSGLAWTSDALSQEILEEDLVP